MAKVKNFVGTSTDNQLEVKIVKGEVEITSLPLPKPLPKPKADGD